ncbi:hypothetical protein P879_11765 [Paragonimus westermani]|uniref:Uncharacterized protein n=1 Tax=Paragonimus westermani TaxID=34504 RepID=A0A8T0D857_9TREM|nr:hypothetical protein P879_11765 [Paragonimus westermani]
MKYRPNCLSPAISNVDALIGKWLGWLPIWDDAVETEHVFGYLCDLLEANNATLLGPDNANLPTIVRAIAEAMSTGGLSDTPSSDSTRSKSTTASGDHRSQQNGYTTGEKLSAYQRCVFILRHIQSNSSLVEACVNQLNEEQRKAVSVALSQ